MFKGVAKTFYEPGDLLEYLEFKVDEYSAEQVNQWLYQVIDAEAVLTNLVTV